MSTLRKVAWRAAVLAALGLLLAGLPPRCTGTARAAEAAEPGAEPPTELEPIEVRPPYLYPGERQLTRMRATLPDLAYGGTRQYTTLERWRAYVASRGDPNALSQREIDWLLSE